MTTALKLDPKRLLSQLTNANSSGCLEIDVESVFWKIYLCEGNIRYVHCSIQTLDQLRYHLHSLGWQEAISAMKRFPKSLLNVSSSAEQIYDKSITWLLAKQHLNLTQTAKLINSISKDNLLSYLWLNYGKSSWQDDYFLPDWISQPIKDSLSLSLAECLHESEIKQNQWRNCSTQLHSVYQRPYFPPSWETKPLPASGSLNHKVLTELTQILRGRTSIRQLSILLSKDELQIAKILSPYIDEKIIYLHHAAAPLDRLPAIPRHKPQSSSPTLNVGNENEITQANQPKNQTKIWKIVCIDDSPTILSEIKRFLDGDKFDITAIDDPVQAVSKIFTINPDLILLDITMPRINGYKLCGLLRSSGKCDRTPIIMVTGNTGLIDKARAKLAGATDYFTKPFSKAGLNQIVAKHLQ